ncbi:MAG TPA: ATP-binding protein [Armatimonadota bacterium]
MLRIAPPDQENLLAFLKTIQEVLNPAVTGLPVATTQRTGFQALAETLHQECASPEEALEFTQTLALPCFGHPYFSIAAEHTLAFAPDQGALLSALIVSLSRLAEVEEFHVWRFVNDDTPMIEITGNGAGRRIALTEREDLQGAMSSGTLTLREGHRLIIPIFTAAIPFAVIEINAKSELLIETALEVSALARVAEQALHRIGNQESETNPVIWQRVLTHLAQEMTVTHSLDDILTTMANQIRQALPCERIAFWTYDESAEQFLLRVLSARLTGHSVPKGFRCPAEDTPLLVAMYSGQPVLLGADWPQRFANFPNANGSINALAVIPLIAEYRCLGVLTIERLEPRPFTRQNVDWLMLVAAIVASAVRNLEIHETLKEAQTRALHDTKMRALGEMAAGIAHDFNNILMSLMCNVELLGIATDFRQVQDRLPKLEQAILDARTIVQRVSAFGRTSEEPAFVPLHLATLIHGTLDFLTPQITLKSVTLQAQHAHEDSTWVAGSATEIREVLINLVTNALHAMEENGTLTISSGRRGKLAYFTVRDTGVGMSPAVLARACDPFFSTKRGMGTGLGLSVSYNIVQRHQGTLRIESEEHVGTTVTVELPLSAAPSATIAVHRESQRNQRILLVDDRNDIAEMLGELLAHLGHQMTLAHGASDALMCCEREHFDLVITDLALHEDTGDSVAQAIRRTLPETPVLLLTGSLDAQHECAELYDGILCKPVTLDNLREAIHQAMALDRRKIPECT